MSTQKQIVPVDDARRIDEIIKQSLPMMSADVTEPFLRSIEIAAAVDSLHEIMLRSPQIKKTIMAMANTRLGFTTDRAPATVAKNKKAGNGPQTVYSYDELLPAVIEGLLRGYRITGNEMTIIAGQFYGGKNGTYRKIKEYPGVTNFRYNNEPVRITGGVALIKCWASWKQGGVAHYLGIDKDDPCFIQVRVNSGMGEDAVIGKAHSKLFKRVFERISGNIDPETGEAFEDIPEAETYDGDQAPKATEPDPRAGEKEKGQSWTPEGDPVRDVYGPVQTDRVERAAKTYGISTGGRTTQEIHADILAFINAFEKQAPENKQKKKEAIDALNALDKFYNDDQGDQGGDDAETGPGDERTGEETADKI